MSITSHYPSWGLGTVQFNGLPHIVGDSLPLMGIGNGSAEAQQGPEKGLITPHGDWELVAAVVALAVGYLSLPLMGIGNVFRGRGADVQENLITPHGDWELAEALDQINAESDSLPLMGIGNNPANRY